MLTFPIRPGMELMSHLLSTLRCMASDSTLALRGRVAMRTQRAGAGSACSYRHSFTLKSWMSASMSLKSVGLFVACELQEPIFFP